jgi:hypothetical protein
MKQTCRVCGETVHDADQRVLVIGRKRFVHCSQACLRVSLNVLRTAQRKARRQGFAFLLATAVAVAGVLYVRHHFHRPRRATPAPTQPVVAERPTTPAEEPRFGPSWPPTDEEWMEQFAHATWVYPLPGPTRRRPASCAQLFVTVPPGKPGARCRTPRRCGADLGGDLWAEHVVAAHDGVIDRIVRGADDKPGGNYIRIVHWGGAVFTQYFHLAGIPSRLGVGMRVNAGDVIGLVGDTGLKDTAAPHLHFALSIRPSSALEEVYWDPEPLMPGWPLRAPERGSVAGLVSIDAPAERVAGPLPLAQRRVAVIRPATKTH